MSSAVHGMHTLVDATFDAGLPVDWLDRTGAATVRRGVLTTEGVCRLLIPLPGRSWSRVCVLIDVTADSVVSLACGDPRTTLNINGRTGHHSLSLHDGGTLTHHHNMLPDGHAHQVTFDFVGKACSAKVGDVTVIAGSLPDGAMPGGSVQLMFAAGCSIVRVRIEAAGQVDRSSPRADRKPFDLEVAVDFLDDLHYAAYTPETFEQMFDIYARWGIRRVHWIYDGGLKHGFVEDAHVNIWEHYQRTCANLGGEVLPHVVRLAHERNIELYGVFKPFEMAHALCTVPACTDAARRIGKIPRVGGPVYWVSRFVRNRRDLIMRRKPGAFGPAGAKPVRRIDLVKDDERPAAFPAEQLRLFVSDDNRTYRPYAGPIQFSEVVEDCPVWEHTSSGGRPSGATRRCRVLRMTGLDLTARYFAVAAPSRRASFAHTLVNLVHVFTDDGEDRMLTYGIQQRVPKLEYDIATAMRSRGDGMDFTSSGIEFDVLPGTPSACLTGFDAIRERYAIDGADGILAIARGKDDTTAGCLSPAFDETRAHWLEWIRDIADAGADGVDVRVRNHHSHLTWAEYGYEQPVRDAFLERHGVDIWATDDFDRTALRRLRGEQYTAFYREARSLLTGRGLPMRLHVSPTLDLDPRIGGAMDMHFDWRTWIDEGLADAVTLKEIYPRSALADEVIERARRRGMRMFFSPFANNIFNAGDGVRICASRIEWARRNGCDGFQFYESCAAMHGRPDGGMAVKQPGLDELFRRLFTGD